MLMIRSCHARIAAALPALLLLATLLLAMLGSQWIGMQHRVAHAWLAAPAADHAVDAADDEGSSDLAHSCILLDAATLSVTLQTAFLLPLCLRNQIGKAQLPAPLSWRPHLFRHFSPRGPPLR
ncbi:hypothetical protein [Noviherbaspirillum aerium]|uniref:hypothetical protein n=1 Tax=Noviherbaspirillum aerium TaxID=2588497 RepID=UPI00124EDE33|nr:hypothetical protein [Noviherbaspirillum aerium]